MQATNISILVEAQGYEGVRRIAHTVAEDFERVVDIKPSVICEKDIEQTQGKEIVLCATVGKSSILSKLEAEGKLSLEKIRGKREVFQIQFVENMLVICGSDKRGTIYGMFTLSEYIGVSPLLFWGDVEPAKRKQIEIQKDIEQVSKEPSVTYRGFFINDEWPCFGNWVCSHFGGFGAEAYQHIFEFLLRMKGNYLWPAMWSASFPLDGPGSANEELADIYGVVMGYSHHEPCLRASEEWDKVRGPETRYGNEWNFYTNREGLLHYWEDALKRSGKYENIITIGMRGERDTSMLGEQATIEENVELLKDIIKQQRRLIAENVNEDVTKVPQLLALYKEVEQYFYGSEKLQGLKDYEELDGVICMLCEDNFGHMRTLPTEDIRNRKGGFGMYYHFDYHGGPISYEWVDSTPLSKTWEQMCMAYEYGIRNAWIVNVGDVKLHEVPLTYFMALAYDYDKWGYGNKNSYKQYIEEWTQKTFPEVTEQLQEDIAFVFTEYIDLNHLRRPEALHEGIYHPCHYGETDRMLKRVERVEECSVKIMEMLPDRERNAYYSMIHFSAMASMNLWKMHLYAGKNMHYAKQGKQIANRYAELTAYCMKKDRQLAEEFAAFRDGKWSGMQLAQHIGFTKWNEDDYRYPVVCRVEPVHKPRMKVSRRDEERTIGKNYGKPLAIRIDDFQYPDCDEVVLEIANDGIGTLTYEIIPENGVMPAWLQLSSMTGEVAVQEEVIVHYSREKMQSQSDEVRLLIKDGDTCVAVDISAKKTDLSGLPNMTFVSGKDGIVIGAEHFCKNKKVFQGAFEVMDGYGKYRAGVKVFPSTAVFDEKEEKPELTYRFFIEEAGDYHVELLTAPTNAVVNKQSVHVMVDNHLGNREALELIPADFRAGESSDTRWAEGVLNQIRISSMCMPFEKGVQELSIGAMEAGVVLERIRIYKENTVLKESYLGPEESLWIE